VSQALLLGKDEEKTFIQKQSFKEALKEFTQTIVLCTMYTPRNCVITLYLFCTLLDLNFSCLQIETKKIVYFESETFF